MQETSLRQLELLPEVGQDEIWQSLDEPQRQVLLDLLARLLLHGLSPGSAEANVSDEAVASTTLIFNPGEQA